MGVVVVLRSRGKFEAASGPIEGPRSMEKWPGACGVLEQ